MKMKVLAASVLLATSFAIQASASPINTDVEWKVKPDAKYDNDPDIFGARWGTFKVTEADGSELEMNCLPGEWPGSISGDVIINESLEYKDHYGRDQVNYEGRYATRKFAKSLADCDKYFTRLKNQINQKRSGAILILDGNTKNLNVVN